MTFPRTADQLKSKYVRIMQEFDLFQSVSQFLGPIKSAADEKAWEKLLNDRPKNAPQLRQFRENGFAHAAICKRIAGTLSLFRFVRTRRHALRRF